MSEDKENSSEKENEELKVVDKRRFSDDGSPKQESKTAQDAQQQSSPKAEQSKPDQEKPTHTDTAERPVDFHGFVMSLGTQAMMLLGDMPSPEGVNIQEDLNGAKQTIDILHLLQEKTKGNLDETEAKFLEEVCHNLRLRYLAKTKKS